MPTPTFSDYEMVWLWFVDLSFLPQKYESLGHLFTPVQLRNEGATKSAITTLINCRITWADIIVAQRLTEHWCFSLDMVVMEINSSPAIESHSPWWTIFYGALLNILECVGYQNCSLLMHAEEAPRVLNNRKRFWSYNNNSKKAISLLPIPPLLMSTIATGCTSWLEWDPAWLGKRCTDSGNSNPSIYNYTWIVAWGAVSNSV